MSEVEIERKKSVIDGLSGEVISASRATELPAGSARNGAIEDRERGDDDLAAVAREAAAAQDAREQHGDADAEAPTAASSP